MGHAWSVDGVNWVHDKEPSYVEPGEHPIQNIGAPKAKWTWMQHDVCWVGDRWIGVGKPQWEWIVAIASRTGVAGDWVELGVVRKLNDSNPWLGQANGPTLDIGPDGHLYVMLAVGDVRGRFDRMRFEVARSLEAVQ
jgi:hypothetical protein